MTDPPGLVAVGRIRRSHGVLGVVVVEPLTGDADVVFAPGREFIAGDVSGEPLVPERRLRATMAEPFQGGYRVQFDAIPDRDEADRWRNRHVLLPRELLPEPAADEIYLHDLIGLRVEHTNGAAVGPVEAYYELPHDVMIEVRASSGSVMIPYRFVVQVDLEGKRVVVDPPEGLLD